MSVAIACRAGLLSAEEERDRRDRPMTDEARSLASDPSLIRAARAYAREAAARYRVDLDEAESEVMLGLCRMAARFDPERDTAPAKFLRTCGRAAVIDLLRSRSASPRHRGVASIDDLGADFEFESTEGPVGELEEWRDEVEWMIAGLKARPRQLLRDLYLSAEHGGRSSSLAMALGVKRREVTRRHNLAMEAIRDRLAGRGVAGA